MAIFLAATWLVLASHAVEAQELLPPRAAAGTLAATLLDDPAALLGLLRARGPLRGERLVILESDGRVLEVIEGEPARVLLPPRLGAVIGSPQRHVWFVHNHPRGHGLSGDDLGMLEAPGLRQIVAVGHDSSLYRAAVGPVSHPFRRARPIPVFELASEAVARELAASAFSYDKHVLDENHAHLVALVLARVGVIDYHARLGRARQFGWEANRVPFQRVIGAAAATLTRRLGGSPPRRTAGAASLREVAVPRPRDKSTRAARRVRE